MRWLDPRRVGLAGHIALLTLVCLLSLSIAPGLREDAAADPGKRELVHLRTEMSETFVDEEGVFSTRLYAQPVHYRMGKRWEKIETVFQAADEGYAWENAANGFRVEFKDKAEEGLVRFETAQGAGFTLALEGATPARGAKQRQNGLLYREVFEHTDLVYALLPDGLKETLVLHRPDAPATYTFTLAPARGTDLKVRQRADGALLFMAGGSPEAAFTFEAPVVADSRDDGAEDVPARGEARLGAQRLPDGTFRIRLGVDPKWLADPERVFPVYLDPSLTTRRDIQDGYYDMTLGGNPDMSSTTLWVGKNGSGGSNYGGAVVFDLASIPSGVTIVDAFANIYLTGCFPTACSTGTKTGTVELRQLMTAWGDSTPWSTQMRGSTVLASKFFSAGQPGVVNAWHQLGNNSSALRNLVQSMVLGQTPNHGFLLEKTGGNANIGFQFASSRWADPNLAPYLDVYWKVDGVQLDPVANVHANGADLFWQRWTGAESTAYVAAVKANTPAAYWRLDEPGGGHALLDENGVHSGSYSSSGVTPAQPGAYTGSLSPIFNGSTGTAWTTSAPDLGSGDFTLEGWFKTSQAGVTQEIAVVEGSGKAELEITTGNKLRGRAFDGTNGITPTSTATVTDGLWHHAAFTRSGSSFTLYLDGVQVAQQTATIGSIGASPTAAIGYEQGVSQFLNGQVDDVAVYTSALSLAQVQTHYNARQTPIPAFDRFEIHRSSSPGFLPSTDTLIATIKDQAIQSYRDTTAKPSATFYYKVVTGAGGNSYNSNEIRADLPAAGQAQVTIQPGGFLTATTRATHINSANPNTKYGSSEALTIDPQTRALLAFELRSIPSGVNVTNAQLDLWTFQTATNATVDVHQLKADWQHQDTTWTATGYGNWANPGADFDPEISASSVVNNTVPAWNSWNVTGLVRAWVKGEKSSLGFLLKHRTETGAPPLSWVSDEYSRSTALRPKLIVTYDDPTATVVSPRTSIVSPAPTTPPAPLSQVKGTVTVKAAANDDGKIASVQFRLDGNPLGSPVTSPPYHVAWDTTTAPRSANPYELSVSATDDAGNVTTSQIVQVDVANSNPPTLGAVSVGSGGQAYDAAVLTDQPKGYWRVAEASGPSAADATANANTGTYLGSVSFAQPGAVTGNTAVTLNGTNGNISVLDANSLDLGDTFTLEAWVKMPATGTEMDVINKGATAYGLRIMTDGNFALRKNPTAQIAVSTTAITPNAFHHIAATKNGTAVKLYLDGVDVTPASISNVTLADNANLLYLGSTSGSSRFLNGSLDEVAVYPTALSPDRIQAHYQAATGSGTTVSVANVNDDHSVSRVEFYAGNDLIGTDTSSPYSIPWDTLNPERPFYDATYAVTAKAYDGDGNTNTSSSINHAVANTAGTKYKATITTNSSIPLELTYDAALEERFPVTVSLTNNSAVSWPTATTKLRYRWIPVRGTTVDSADVSIGATDLLAGGNRTVVIFGPEGGIAPPALPTGVFRARYTLRIDVVDTSNGTVYFASQGNAPFEKTVTVTRAEKTELGLERYQQYDGEALGGAFTNAVNLANGNNLVAWEPFNQPGRGLNTRVALTYNSLEQGSVSPLGNNWSLAISSLTPFGLPLDIHPNAADTAAGRTANWVGFTDGDGTYHRFTGNTAGTYYTAPAGVHLYLKKDATAPADKRWQLVKPDRTTFYFDSDGYSTRVQDKDTNALTFTLEPVPAAENAFGLAKRVAKVTDAGGRDFTLTYYTSADRGYSLVLGKLKTIADHLGHKLRFDYYTDGNLLRITEEGGTNADGSYLADRSAVLTYTTADLTGPAIPGATSARLNPDPGTLQSPKLFSLIDFRGNETTFAYEPTGATKGRLKKRTNRASAETTFNYAGDQTTVAMPLGRTWAYTFHGDGSGRVTAIDDPVNTLNTTVEWTGDNQVQKVTEPTGRYTTFAYNANGYLTEKTDQLGNRTTIAYENFPVDVNDVTGNWTGGRTIGHISRVQRITQPQGNANAAAYSSLGPVGGLIAYAGSDLPSGWLRAEGGAVSRTGQASLYATIDTTYGTGDGSTTFNLPDLRGRIVFGKGTNPDIDALGKNEGFVQPGDLVKRRPKHKHTTGSHTALKLSGTGTQDIGHSGSHPTTALTVGPQTNAPTDAPAYVVVNYLIRSDAVAQLPVGTIVAYAGSTAPTGWLLANGQQVLRSSALGVVLGGNYGNGDGVTTYNIPDLQGRVPVGKGTNTDVDALGENEGFVQASDVDKRRPKHKHTPGPGLALNVVGGGGDDFVAGPHQTTAITVGPQTNTPTDAPAYLVLNYLIKSDAAAVLPVGAVLPYAGSASGPSYALADGSPLHRIGQAALYGALSDTFGTGDGSTTFNLPNLRGRMAVGKGPNADVDALNDRDDAILAGRGPKHKHTTGPTTAVFLKVPGGGGQDFAQEIPQGHDAAPITVGPQTDAPTDGPAYLTLNYLVRTGVNPNAYTTTFAYTNNTNDQVASITDAYGNQVTNTWNPIDGSISSGTLATQTLPATGDSFTRKTTFSDYDASGLPTRLTQEVTGGTNVVTTASFDAAGRLNWVQDALHQPFSGPDTRNYRTQIEYDSFGRLGRESQPKSTSLRPGLLVWSSTVYDANDNVTSTRGAGYGRGDGGNGAPTTISYDTMDRPTLTTGPRALADGGPVESKTEYDAAGRVIRATAPNGMKTAPSGGAWEKDFVTETSYDLLDRVLTQSALAVNASGILDGAQTRTTSICYDLAGDPRSVTAPNGAGSFGGCPAIVAPDSYSYTTATHTTKYTYDAAHRPLTTTNAGGQSSKLAYDANGQATQATDEAGKATSFAYDDRGLKTTVVAPFDGGRTLTTRYEYDALGQLKQLTSPRAYDTSNGTDYVESYSYDALGRPVKTILPKQGPEEQAYTHRTFDALGRLTMVSLPSTQADPGQLTAADKTTSTYWDSGEIASFTEGATGLTVRYGYTAEGWQAERLTDTTGTPGVVDYGRAMYWDYLPDGLLSAVRDLGGQREVFSYDANGNQTLAVEASGITTAAQSPLRIEQTFDGFDQLTKVRVPKGSQYAATRFAYDLHGNTTQLVDNAIENGAGAEQTPGRVYTYSFNELDQPTMHIDDFGSAGSQDDDERATYTYTLKGQLDARTLWKWTGAWAQEQKQETSYFDNGKLRQLKNYDGGVTPIEEHDLSYVRTGVYENGNRVSDTFKRKSADPGVTWCWQSACTASWEYDGRGRLIKESPDGNTVTTFTLDAIGNVLQENGGVITRSYSGQRLISQEQQGGTIQKYVYDSLGNIDCVVRNTWTQPGCPSPGSTDLIEDYTSDYRSRLQAYRRYNNGLETDSADYVNDGLDRPVAQIEKHDGTQTTISFQHVGASNALSSESHTGATNATRKYSYDALGSHLTLADTPSGGQTRRYSYLTEPHGSVSLVIDQTNNVKASYGYASYGTPHVALTHFAGDFTASTNAYRYGARRFDTGSNTYDMGARRYSPSAGRFLQHDMYYGALANLGLSTNPLTQNRYAFAAANPINFIEIDGHYVVDPENEGQPLVPPQPGWYNPPDPPTGPPRGPARPCALDAELCPPTVPGSRDPHGPRGPATVQPPPVGGGRCIHRRNLVSPYRRYSVYFPTARPASPFPFHVGISASWRPNCLGTYHTIEWRIRADTTAFPPFDEPYGRFTILGALEAGFQGGGWKLLQPISIPGGKTPLDLYWTLQGIDFVESSPGTIINRIRLFFAVERFDPAQGRELGLFPGSGFYEEILAEFAPTVPDPDV